jgi:hypothetical protein
MTNGKYLKSFVLYKPKVDQRRLGLTQEIVRYQIANKTQRNRSIHQPLPLQEQGDR